MLFSHFLEIAHFFGLEGNWRIVQRWGFCSFVLDHQVHFFPRLLAAKRFPEPDLVWMMAVCASPMLLLPLKTNIEPLDLSETHRLSCSVLCLQAVFTLEVPFSSL